MMMTFLPVRAEGNVLVTDGGSVIWDLNDAGSVIYTAGSDGSLSAEGEYSHNNGHGLYGKSGSQLKIAVPDGKTTVTLEMCFYSKDFPLMISAENGRTVTPSSMSAKAAADGDTAEVVYEGEATTLVFTANGEIYYHSITAETVTPPKTASVSGSVSITGGSLSAEGQKLVFTDQQDGSTTEAVIENGSYSVELPVGKTYTVAFAESSVYEVTGNAVIDLTSASDGESADFPVSCRVIWDSSRSFAFTIADTQFTVTPGSSDADFTVQAEGGSGSVELATSAEAVIWADLGGAGSGTLSASDISVTDGDVTAEVSDNTAVFRFADTSVSPYQYTVHVKDNSASGVPHADGVTRNYSFTDGSVVSDLHTGNYVLKNGSSVMSSDKLVTLTGNNKIAYHDNQHGITISEGDTISVKVAGNAVISFNLCSYTDASGTFTVSVDGNGTISTDSFSAAGSSDGAETVISYEGEAAEITFTYSGSTCYLHGMSLTNNAPETEVTEQEKMPYVMTYGNPEALDVSVSGQTMTFEQNGGELSSGEAVSDSISYYGFDPAEDGVLEADVTVLSGGSSSSNGVFFGIFNETDLVTLGIRKSSNLRGMYTSSDGNVHAGGVDEAAVPGETVHFRAEKSGDAWKMTAVQEDGTVWTYEHECESSPVSFGLIFAGVKAEVENMKYTSADGTVLYDQNSAYEAVGTKPVVTSVSAAVNSTREGITVSWHSAEEASGDGVYVVEMRRSSEGDWTVIAETQEASYELSAPLAEDGGYYEFRVGGRLGNGEEPDYCAETAVIENYIPALERPAVTAEGDETGIVLTWNAVTGAESYEIWRYASGEDASAAVKIADTAESRYEDADVEAEVPYYYYVTAMSSSNSGNPSDTVWAMSSGGHIGDYVYEEEAAELTMTEEPSDTVFASEVTFSGTADRSGTLELYVNGALQQTVSVDAGNLLTRTLSLADGSFSVSFTAAEGRNDAELIFTDDEGAVTRKYYNIVYLTNYDMVVDAASDAADGTEVNGIPVYRTVQAAVDAAPADGTEKTVILIRSGDYEERLVVGKPNISLVGEDRDGVRIHCYPADLYPGDSDYEAGGDMSKRCAVYVTSAAAGFSAENLTFANDYDYGTPDGKSNKSADALRCDADQAVFVNVRISGVQDSLYMNSGHQYFYRCRIEGLIDFIYSGDDARALFDDCEIVFVYEETHSDSGYVCAPRTAADASYGLIFKDCAVFGEEGLTGGEGTDFRLARPWGSDGYIVWINCYMGSILNAEEPYAEMSGNTWQAARFYECGSYGPGYAVNANRPQISPDEAEAMLTTEALGWDYAAAASSVSADYQGDIVTETPDQETPATPEPSVTPEPTVEPEPSETPEPTETPEEPSESPEPTETPGESSETPETSQPSSPESSEETEADDEASEDSNVTQLHDEATDITVSFAEGVLPEGVTLKVEEIADTRRDEILAILGMDQGWSYDISLYDAEGNEITSVPQGVTVSIPVPEELSGKSLSVYYTDGISSIEEYPASVQNGYAQFSAVHFSIYTLAVQKQVPTSGISEGSDSSSVQADTSKAETGVYASPLLWAGVLAAAAAAAGFVLYTRKKKK